MPSLRRPPIVGEICERLLRKHRAEEWLPSERTLSTRLGVSRSALREAIQRLEIQGLLEVRHGIGIRVVNRPHVPLRATLLRELPDVDERVRQFSEVRVLVEPEIARRAAKRATPEHHATLHAAHARLAEASDDDTAVQADLEFHRLLADFSGNRILALMLASIAGLEEEARRITLTRVGLAEALAQHQRIYVAVAAGDAQAAHAAMLAHVVAARDELEKAAVTPLSLGKTLGT